MVALITGCQMQGCVRRATHEVRAYNEPAGHYCKKHAEQRVEALTKAEANNPGGWR